MAKPDNRADNVERIQFNINHTISNFNEAEEYLAEHADEITPQDRQAIEAKNERRLQSLQSFREEIRDEAKHREQS
ncbi:small acid-soluble spore protein Tlp [Paenibacillus sp. S-38]|uniref:small acid-soluble spore protein Tlp n=1 Tax=Paenibacillus sp. S-38 TaxID=3416710 RepID=UPI003CE79EA1